LPFGQYLVHVAEYIAPFSEDSSATPTDTSSISTSFQVAVDGCPPGAGCYMLDFEADGDSSAEDSVGPACDASAIPGGNGCFNVTLSNEVPVAGIEVEIMVNDEYYDAFGSPPGLFKPVSVEAVGRAASFQIAWTNTEASRAKVLLYSTSGATLPPGQGSILRVCYRASGQAGMGGYPIRFTDRIVSDPNGVALPACPTFAEVVGSFCVVSGACDLDGDGVSNIQDIVLLVGCALGESHPPVSCPDHGCVDDGHLDIRDVVCCIRRILDGGNGFGTGNGSGAPWRPGMTRIGFVDAPRWVDPSTGRVSLAIEPGLGFGGIQFAIGETGAAKIRTLAVVGLNGSYSMEWSDAGGEIRAMIYRNDSAQSGAALEAPGALVPPIRVDATFEPIPGASGATTFSLKGVTAATTAGAAAEAAVESGTASISSNPVAAPAVFAPAPNPFVSETGIDYTLPSATRVTIRVYDVNGRWVRTLTDAGVSAGPHSTSWDGRDGSGRDLGSGIYFVKFVAGSVEKTNRVLKLR